MLELVFGALLGSIVSLLIAEAYHRRSSADMERRLKELDALIQDLMYAIEKTNDKVELTARKVEETRLDVVAGTPSHPDWPYK